jgi:hypothetical protein
MNKSKLSEADSLVYLEVARRALADADLFDEMAASLDISDAEMIRLREQLENHLSPCLCNRGECPECGG